MSNKSDSDDDKKKTKKHKKEKSINIPEGLILLKNKDKENDEKWHVGREPSNLPCPFRLILSGGVGKGKSTQIKNILLRAKPLYDRLIIVCCDKTTKDYDDLEPHLIIDQLPSVESFDNKHKNCLVIDDYRAKTQYDKNLLDRLFGYVSSHKKTSIMYATQDLFSLFTPTIQRMSDCFILWKSHDENQFNMICNRVGMKNEDVKQIFKDLNFGEKDALMIDKTPNTPYPLRKNIFDIIEIDEVPNVEKENIIKKKPVKKIKKTA